MNEIVSDKYVKESRCTTKKTKPILEFLTLPRKTRLELVYCISELNRRSVKKEVLICPDLES